MQQAPFFADVATGPASGAAYWLHTADQRRIRVGLWAQADAKASILICPGRTEYIEKYDLLAQALVQAGYSVLAVDWRGQGLADRLIADRRLGHVDDFAQYQIDLRAVLDFARTLPPLRGIFAHSMGGCIALRALMDRTLTQPAVFSAPMWGIKMPAATHAAAVALTAAAPLLRQTQRLAPGQVAQSYLLAQPFAGNMLTSDAASHAALRAHITQHPDLGLGGPTLGWLGAALREMRALARLPAPDLPVIGFLGSDETIVTPAAIVTRMAAWRGAVLHRIPGARHEMLYETAAIRADMLAKTIAHFDAHH